ncbi:MAG: C25 family cysteine peptidase [bacterium]|nr:C25 family cysteine peptidase [bacterium]
MSGHVASNTGGSSTAFTTWKFNDNDDLPFSGNVSSDIWYSDAGNIDTYILGETFVTKIDYQSGGGGSSHTGYYAVTSDVIRDDGGITFFPEATLQTIPVPQIIAVRSSQVDLSWAAAQYAGTTNVIAGYDVYYYQTTSTSYLPTDADTWTKANASLITGTTYTVTTPNNTDIYYFALKIIYTDTFSTYSTAFLSGNSQGVKPNPTAVELISFNATGTVGGIKLNWATGTEIRNLGFNLYRSTVSSGGDQPRPYDGYVQINKYLIAGLGTSALGSNYDYTDYDVEPGTTYYYLLEDVEFDGKTKSHGPVSAVALSASGIISSPENLLPADNNNPNLSENISGRSQNQNSDTGGNQDHNPPANGNLNPVNPPPANGGGKNTQNGNVILLQFPGLAGNPSQWQAIPFERVVAIPDCENVSLGQVRSTDIRQVSADVGQIFRQQNREWNNAQKNLDPLGLSRMSSTSANRLNAPLVQIAEAGYLRGQRIAVLKVNPVQPGAGVGTYQVSETIEIKLNLGECRATDPLLDSDLLSGIFRGLGRLSQGLGARHSLPFGQWLKYLEADEQWKLITLSGQAVKLGIDKDGICRVPLNNLSSLGLRTRGLRVFYQGEEIPVELAVAGAGVSDSRDVQKRFLQWLAGAKDNNLELRFVGRKPDSKYTRTSVYWIVPDLRMGSSLPRVSGSPESGLPGLSKVTQVQLLEQNKNYFANMPGGDPVDHWYWDYLVSDQPKDFALEIPDPAAGAEGSINLSVIGLLEDPAIENENHLRVVLNRVVIGEISWGGRGEISASFSIPAGVMNASGNTLTLTLVGDTGAVNNVILLNSIEVSYLRSLSGSSGKVRFQVPTDANVEIPGFPGGDIMVYRLGARTDQARVIDLNITQQESGYQVKFRAATGEYMVLTAGALTAQTFLLRDQSSMLKDPSNEADLIIISPSAFRNDLAPLASARAEEGLRVSLVDVQDIYDEFNYGQADPQAIRDFIGFTYHQWVSPAPAYVLLVGDASYDFKDYMGTGNTGFIPAPQVTNDYLELTAPSDNWYACVDGTDEIPDLAIGRLPARTPAEVQTMVAKILALKGRTLAGEKVLVSADNDDPIFEQGMEAAAAILTPGFDITRAYLGSLGLEATRQMILNSLLEGRGIFEYAGHSAIDKYAQEDIFGVADVSSLAGNGKTFLAVALSCLGGYFDVPYLESLGEELVRLPNGGAYAGLFSSGFTYPEQQIQLNNVFLHSLVDGETLGSSFLKAKISQVQGGGSPDILRSYHLFGDPSARLE